MEDDIHVAATETVSFIRRQERQLVAALRHKCTRAADGDDVQKDERKKSLSEHVRRLEDACDGAQRLLNAAVADAAGPAAFLLQRRRTVDAMTTSLMTSQPTGAADWSTRQQVRFEAYGLDSALGLRVGRLVADDDDEDAGSRRTGRDDVSSPRQRVHAVTVPSVDSSGEWVEVRLIDVGVQTLADDVRHHQSLTVSSTRCEASGGASATRHGGGDAQLLTSAAEASTSARRRTTDAETSTEPRTLYSDASTSTPVTSLSDAETSTSVTLLCDAVTLTEPVTLHSDASTSTTEAVMTSLCDAETSTRVTLLCDAQTSTVTSHDAVTSTTEAMTSFRHAETSTEPVMTSAKTNTEPWPDVCRRSTSTEPLLQSTRGTSTERLDTRDQLQTRSSVSVTAAPLMTDKSTSTVSDLPTSSQTERRLSDDSLTELISDVDKNLTQTTSASTCSVSSVTALQTPQSYAAVDDSSVSAQQPVTSLQASTVDVPDVPGSADRESGFQAPRSYECDGSFVSAQSSVTSVQASSSGVSQAPGSSESRSDDMDSARLAALLPELARTADVLSASHFTSGLTARLLRDVVDVAERMTSSTCRLQQTQDAATDTTDLQTHQSRLSATTKVFSGFRPIVNRRKI